MAFVPDDEDETVVLLMGVVLCYSGRAQFLVLGNNTGLIALTVVIVDNASGEGCGVLLFVGLVET